MYILLFDKFEYILDCSQISHQLPILVKSLGAIQYDMKELKKTLKDIQDQLVSITAQSLIACEENSNLHNAKLPVDTEQELTEMEDKLENPKFFEESVSGVDYITFFRNLR